MRLSPARVHAALATAITLLALSAVAQPLPGEGPRKPPAEALAACKASTAGSDCSFTGPRGAQKGTCWAPEGKPLACRPKAPAEGASRPKTPGK